MLTTILRHSPGYPHQHEGGFIKSDLTAETAYDSYNKLYSYLAIQIDCEFPAVWRNGTFSRDKLEHRSLFYWNGFHHPVRWMPKLKLGWRRLRYDEFCAFYSLTPFDDRAKEKGCCIY